MSFSVSANKEQGTNLGGSGEERGVLDNRLDLNNSHLSPPIKTNIFILPPLILRLSVL